MGELRKGFYWLSRAWYAEVIGKNEDEEDDIVFGLYDEEGGTTGEVNVVWVRIRDYKRPVPKLVAYDDGWEVLFSFSELIQKMRKYDSKSMSPGKFVNLLKECGFKDLTVYENPYKKGGRERNEII